MRQKRIDIIQKMPVPAKSEPDMLLLGKYALPYLYVTPLEDSIRTFCLFFLTPLPADSPACPLVFVSDLYTAAMLVIIF
jgi:hypothetical protein